MDGAYPRPDIEEREDEVVDAATAARTGAELRHEIGVLAGLVDVARRVRLSGTDRKWAELSDLLTRTPEIWGGPFGDCSSSSTRASSAASATPAGGRKSNASTIPNITVFAPIPIASVNTATSVKPREVRSLRAP